jgi:hypothetical protein
MKRKAERDLEAEKLLCSLENKEACVMYVPAARSYRSVS